MQLEREHALEKYAAGAQETLGWLEAAADFYGTEVDDQIAKGEGYVEWAQDEIRRVYVESGEILTGVVEDVGEAFAQIREDYDEWIASIGEAGNPFEGEGNANSSTHKAVPTALRTLMGHWQWRHHATLYLRQGAGGLHLACCSIPLAPPT